MKILLINSPVTRTSPHAKLAPPLGVAYLAGYARAHGHEVEVLDLNLTGYNPRRLELVLKRSTRRSSVFRRSLRRIPMLLASPVR